MPKKPSLSMPQSLEVNQFLFLASSMQTMHEFASHCPILESLSSVTEPPFYGTPNVKIQ
jgi:hypothetical protein